MKFDLGQVVITRACKATMESINADPLHYLALHVNGDWGELGTIDKEANELAIKRGLRIVSRYKLPNRERIYIITEHDRSYTTMMMRDEY